MKLRFSAVIITLAIVTSISAQSPTSSKRSITEKDLFDFVWIANPQLAPDGSRVAFTRVVVDEKRTGYETSIWTVATSGSESPIRLTNGRHDGQPRWSPDGKSLERRTTQASPSLRKSRSSRSSAAKHASLPTFRKAPPIPSGLLTASASPSRVPARPKTSKKPSARKALPSPAKRRPNPPTRRPSRIQQKKQLIPTTTTNPTSTSSAAPFIVTTTKATSIPSVTNTSGCSTSPPPTISPSRSK
jgi:dipeptidyl aminopeptidase/acylaminoacyl peptidase